MDDFETKFQKEGQGVHKRRSEKETIKRRILTLPVTEPIRRPVTPWGFLHAGRFAAATFVFVLMLGSLPLTYAAQHSAPGDFLHDLELSFIEPLEASVQFTPAARVAYSTDRLEERLQELQHVIEEGMTSADAEVVTENVKTHVEEVLATVTENGDKKQTVDHLATISALLNVQEDVLAGSDGSIVGIQALNEGVTEELSRQIEALAEGREAAELVQAVQEAVSETSQIIEDELHGVTAPAVAEQLENVQREVLGGDFEEALHEAVDAKVEALAQEYVENAEEQL